jgi:hypothetical protein
MNNQEKYNEDLLRQYISSEMIEKAPEGFTSKVMNRVRLEPLPVNAAERSRKRNLVPVISLVVTIILIASAILIPGSQSDSVTIPGLNIILKTRFTLPDINLSSIFKFNLPSIIMYAFIGILILTVFDRALYGVFHREK